MLFVAAVKLHFLVVHLQPPSWTFCLDLTGPKNMQTAAKMSGAHTRRLTIKLAATLQSVSVPACKCASSHSSGDLGLYCYS